MKKIALLGDSIRLLGYGMIIPSLLNGEYEVYQPDDNCRNAKYTLRALFDWAEYMKGAEIVHWNNGIWDVTNLYGDGCLSPLDEYVRDMLRIYDVLSTRYTKKIIFATTTPVIEPNDYQSNSVIKTYNAAIVPELVKRGVVINDLHALISEDTSAYIRADDHLHLTVKGAEVAAKQVIKYIRSVDRRSM